MRRNRFARFSPAAIAIGIVAGLFVLKMSELTPTELDFNEHVTTADASHFTGLGIARFQNGQLHREIPFKDGKVTGVVHTYDLQGKLVELQEYDHGLRSGIHQAWYSEGPRRFEHRYAEDRMEGLQTDWHLSGAIFRQEVFHDGKIESKKILFDNGAIFSNYVIKGERTFGIDGGALCMEKVSLGAFK